MLNGKFRDRDIGSGTSVWEFSEDVRGGKMTLADFMDAEAGMSRLRWPLHDDGHGLDNGVDGRSAWAWACHQTPRSRRRIPRRKVVARMVGQRIVDMVKENLTIDKILNERGFRERDHGERRHWWFDQRHAVHLFGHRRPSWRRVQPRRLGSARPRHAVPREPHALRQIPDGGLLLCRVAFAGGDQRDR